MSRTRVAFNLYCTKFFSIKRDDYNVLIHNNKIFYFGKLEDNKPQGFGVMYNESSDTFYVGQFDRGMRHGDGRTVKITTSANVSMALWSNNKIRFQIAVFDEDPDEIVDLLLSIYKDA